MFVTGTDGCKHAQKSSGDQDISLLFTFNIHRETKTLKFISSSTRSLCEIEISS